MKLLINEPPLQVLPTLAVHLGLNEALVLQQIHWLCGSRHCVSHAGHSWFRASYEGFVEVFPFFSDRTIRRVVSGLIESGYLMATTECNSVPMDKTRAYRVNYERLDELEQSHESRCGQFGHMHLPQENERMHPAKLATSVGVAHPAKLAGSSLSKRTDSKRSARSDDVPKSADRRDDEERLAEECREAIWIYSGGDRVPWMQSLVEFCEGLIRRGTVIPPGTVEQAARLGLAQWRREHPGEQWPRWNTLLTQHLVALLTPESPETAAESATEAEEPEERYSVPTPVPAAPVAEEPESYINPHTGETCTKEFILAWRAKMAQHTLEFFAQRGDPVPDDAKVAASVAATERAMIRERRKKEEQARRKAAHEAEMERRQAW